MAQRPEELVELLPEAERFLAREAAVGEPAERAGLVLVHDLAGDFDAAHAGALAGAHLLAALPHEVIARFDADSLVDYRAHRPRMTFSGDRYESFAAPEILLYAVEDDAGVPFLLLHGTEPDYAWERFVRRRRRSWSSASASPRSLAMQAIPMPVPHTRPVTVTAHATRRQLIEPYPVYWGEMRIPGSVSALLELRLGERGRRRPRRGRARAALPGPGRPTRPPSLTLLEHLERLTGLHLPTEALPRPRRPTAPRSTSRSRRSPENTAVVAALEQQYDNFTAAREGTDLLGERRRGAERRGDRRGVRAVPGRPGPRRARD